MSDSLDAGATSMTRDFLLELRSEEIPARMQAGARADLEKLFRKALGDAGVALGEITVWSTPRRLALIARGLPLATAAVSEELKGPRVGAPPQALEGFLRKTGLSETDLVERDGVLFAVIEKPGRATADVLAEAIPAIIRTFPWPKSQRWGAASISTESLRWVRPLSAIVALLDGAVVPFEIDGLASGRLTRGHRFHSEGEIEIAGADDYAQKLRAAHVIVDHEARQDLIRDGAAAAAHAEGLLLVADEGLVVENAGLTEWPVPLLGRFDAAFLDVPPEVIQLTARTNQKYFVCEDGTGKLANAFVCTANIVALDGGTEIVAGNRKVLAARLSDARFFWEQDRKVSLEEQAKKLGRITFHEKLGTVADKAERVAKLARWLVEEGIVNANQACSPAQAGASGLSAQPPEAPAFAGEQALLAGQAELAARLCKADLVTEMVGEFPELQGLMGGYYARAEGLPNAVADAIRDHYKPVGQGDDVPTAPVTVAVSLADKLDNLFQLFSVFEVPTGSKDPFALRRAAIGVYRLIVNNGISFLLSDAIKIDGANYMIYKGNITPDFNEKLEKVYAAVSYAPAAVRGDKVLRKLWASEVLLSATLMQFFSSRIAAQLKAEGKKADCIQAALLAEGSGNDILIGIRRANALQAFVGTEDGTNLLAGYKRAANILKKEDFAGGEEIALSYTPVPAEKALIDALSLAGPTAATAVGEERFADAMAALATLREPIDAFFEEVTVNDADPAKRSARLSLLAQFRDAVHGVADFSKIEG